MTMKKSKAPEWTKIASTYKKKVKVLDNGFVEYVSHMGDDVTVVNAARVSFAKESDWEYGDVKIEKYGTTSKKQLGDKDRKLIDYLAKHNHWTPLRTSADHISCESTNFHSHSTFQAQSGNRGK